MIAGGLVFCISNLVSFSSFFCRRQGKLRGLVLLKSFVFTNVKGMLGRAWANQAFPYAVDGITFWRVICQQLNACNEKLRRTSSVPKLYLKPKPDIARHQVRNIRYVCTFSREPSTDHFEMGSNTSLGLLEGRKTGTTTTSTTTSTAF